MSLEELFRILLPGKEAQLLEWLQNHHLLKEKVICRRSNCGRPMKIVPCANRNDHFQWQCQCLTSQSIRCNSFFSNSDLSLQIIILIIYLWSVEMSPSSANSVAGVSEETVVEWFNWVREECAKKLIRLEADGQLLGGPGRTVEIRLSIIVKKQKGKEEQWAFGMYERERKVGCIELVDNRKADTLVEIMQRLVQPGSIVYSDPDEAYNTLGLMGYKHSVVSRKRALDTDADTVPELHTNCVLSFMSCAKKAIKADENHTPVKLILQEFMWRKRYGPLSEAFKNIIEQIAAS